MPKNIGLFGRIKEHFNWLPMLLAILGKQYQFRTALLACLTALQAALESAIVILGVVVLAIASPVGTENFGAISWISWLTGTTDKSMMMLWCGAAVIVLFIAGFFLRAATTWSQANLVYSLRRDTARRVLESYLDAPFYSHVAGDNTKRMDMALNQSAGVSQLVGDFFAIASSVLRAGALVLVAFWLNPMLTILTALVLGPICVFGYVLISRRLTIIGTDDLGINQTMSSSAMQLLWSYREVKIFGVAHELLDQFTRMAEHMRGRLIEAALLRQLPRMTFELLFGIAIGVCCIAYALQVSALTSRLPELLGIAVAGWRIVPMIIDTVSGFAQIRLRAPRLNAIFDVIGNFQEQPHVHSDATLPIREKLSICSVSVKYPGQDKPAIENVTAEISKGTLVGIFGASGSGKTTLINCLLGFVPHDNGRIDVDGVPIASDLPAWRRTIGFVPQEPMLFDSSIRDNITFSRHFTDEDQRLERVIGLVKLQGLVKSQAKGLKSRVGERGVLLSGGQRQRVTIARALIGEPSLLILDEPASALDPEVTAAIDDTLETFRGDITTIIVTHRPATIARCDRILFMEAGHLVAVGTYDELMRNQRFAALVNAGQDRRQSLLALG